MDLFHEDSDPLSSQATQLLQHALASDSAQSQEHSRDLDQASPEDKGNATKDFSLDSRIIPARTSTPHYRLQDSLPQSPNGSGQHMLAAVEGSQKENVIPVSCCENKQLDSSARTTEMTPPSLDNVAAQGSSSEAFDQYQHGDSPLSASTGKVIGARTITFQSPTTTGPRPVPRATKSMPVGSRYYPRSPSPSSQDSFGGLVSQDPAEQYLASAKQFDVPLSDLGETPTQEVVNQEPSDPGLTLPDASEHKEFLEAAMREYEAQRANRTSSSNRRGNILVAATPSNSDESSGTSQHKDNGFSFHKLAAEQESRYDFDGASSFDKMLDRGLVDGPEPTPEATQPNEFDPTQVDDPVPLEVQVTSTTPPRSDRQPSPSFPWIAPSPSAAVTSSNPRSLLSMVHPKNQYRIARMRHMGADVEPPSHLTRMETQLSRIQETQPSHVDEMPRSKSPSPPMPKAPSHRGHRYQPCADSDPEDALDVVPDSEPLRAGPSAPSPSHRRGGVQSPLKHSARPPSPMSDHESGDPLGSFEESEADVPLAIKVATRGTEDLSVTVGEVSAPNRKPRPIVPAVSKAPSPGDGGRPTSATMKGKNSKSKSESIAVPTSLPEQDLASSSGQSSMLTAKRRGRKSLPQEPPRPRTTSTTGRSTSKPVAGKKRSHSSDTESSEEWSHQPTEDDRRLPLPQEEEEDSEDDHTHDMPVDSPPPKAPLSRKKKRRLEEDTKPPRGMLKASATTTRSKRSETPVAAALRSAKRLRSAGLSSIRGSASEMATRVFALWKSDGHYYSGVVHSLQPKNQYQIKFDDGDNDVVEIKNMRRRELLVGDRVIYVPDNVKGTVCDVSQMDSHGSLKLEVDYGNGPTILNVMVKNIRIANRTVQGSWKERTVTPDTIVTMVNPKCLPDTTPSKQSLLSATLTQAQRELAKTGFVVTLSPKNVDPVRAKETAILAIQKRGGTVIEDWSNVFTMEGKHSHANKRWEATPKDFGWKPSAKWDRVFLLSDDAHQKPKFLLALALGIPCLSFDWLTNETFSSDWQPFLLPAGYSDTLGARVSQIVDLDWGNCIEHLTDIMANRVPPKLFSNKVVLCVGVDLVPPPASRARKNTSDAERLREAAQCVPWIILCMGAAKVEAVADVKQVSPDHMRTFDYIVAKEQGDLASVDIPNGIVVGSVRWIKDCLACSRMLAPDWD